jgi:[acyl-carrier-protein] S-malonyltransferase
MGAPWKDHESWELVEEASDIAGRDVAQLLLEADQDELTQTRNSQLVTFVMSLVVLDAVERLGVAPSMAAGHSLGEYTALTATGALDFADGVRIVTARGEAMQQAAEDAPGTMAAVLGLDDEDCDAACRRADGEVWVANFNAPGQVVIAGSKDGVAAAGAVAKEMGAKKVMPLPVGGAFHTPFMASARDELRKAIAQATLRAPDIPVAANIDARIHTDADDWAGILSAQLVSPVRWRQSILRLSDDGCLTFVELGAGSVLTGMAKRIVPEARALAVSVPDDLDKLLEVLAGESTHARALDGEQVHLYMTERIVIAPTAGIFVPDGGHTEGSAVEVGDVLGHIGEEEVRSAFAGTVGGFVALDGERVTASQPIVWLRTA